MYRGTPLPVGMPGRQGRCPRTRRQATVRVGPLDASVDAGCALATECAHEPKRFSMVAVEVLRPGDAA